MAARNPEARSLTDRKICPKREVAQWAPKGLWQRCATPHSFGVLCGGFIVLVALLFCVPVLGYEFATTPTGATLHLPGGRQRVTVGDVVPRGIEKPDYLMALRQALMAWESPITSGLVMEYIGIGGGIPSEGEDEGAMAFVAFCSWPDCWQDSFGRREDTLAHTVLSYNPQTGQINSSSTLFNDVDFDWSTTSAQQAYDLTSATVHELGYGIGLANPCGPHSTRYPSCESLPDDAYSSHIARSVMFPGRQPGAVSKRTLGFDDSKAVSELYPAQADSPSPEPLEVEPSTVPFGPKIFHITGRNLPDGGAVHLRTREGLTVATGILETLSSDVYGRAAVYLDIPEFSGLYDVEVVSLAGKHGVAFHALEVTPVGVEFGGGGGCRTVGLASGRRVGTCAVWVGLALLVSVMLGKWRMRYGKGKAFTIAFLALTLHLTLSLLWVPAAVGDWQRSQSEENGIFLWWPGPTILYRVDPQAYPAISDGSDLAAVQSSFETWNSIVCPDGAFYLSLVDDGSLQRREIGFDSKGHNENAVFWIDDPDEWNEIFRERDAIALTNLSYYTATGEIVDGDIVFNSAHFTFSTRNHLPRLIDIQNTMTHEVGHLIGLDHSSNPNATMFAYASHGEISKRQLHQDDIDGACSLSPPEDLPKSSTSSGGCGCALPSGAPDQIPNGLLVMLLMGVAIFLPGRFT